MQQSNNSNNTKNTHSTMQAPNKQNQITNRNQTHVKSHPKHNNREY